jgi:hypothetical protein
VTLVIRPLASITVAGAIALIARLFFGHLLSVLPRLILESTVLLSVYFILLFFVAGQKELFMDLIRGWRGTSPAEPKSLVVSA